MNSITSRKPGGLGEWWPDWRYPWRSRGLDRFSLRCHPGAGCRHRPARTARPQPIHLRACRFPIKPCNFTKREICRLLANNVGVTARFVTNPELTDDTDVTRWVLVPRVTYWPA